MKATKLFINYEIMCGHESGRGASARLLRALALGERHCCAHRQLPGHGCPTGMFAGWAGDTGNERLFLKGVSKAPSGL